MNGNDKVQSLLGHIHCQHRQMTSMIHALDKACSVNRPTTEECQNIFRQLHQLRDHMQQHFAEEDAGGCLEEAVVQSPHLAHHLREIEQQHSQLLTELDQIILVTEGQSPGFIRQQFDAIRSFTLRLLGHEALENHLLQAGFNEDLGLDDLP